jgi:MATE family multidrug resistance protein
MPTMVIGFVGLAVNIPANYIFIHGHFGMPKLGGVGCGVATAIVLWAMLLAMIVYVKCSAHFKRINLFAQLARPNGSRIWRLFRLGFPIAMAIFCEVTLFTVVALMLAPSARRRWRVTRLRSTSPAWSSCCPCPLVSA